MRDFFRAGKTVPLVIIIFLISFITLFLIVEFRFLKETINEYRTGVRNIAISKTTGFINEMVFFTESNARKIARGEQFKLSPGQLDDPDRKIVAAYIIPPRGQITRSPNNPVERQFPVQTLLKRAMETREAFIFAPKDRDTRSLLAAAPIFRSTELRGFFVAEYSLTRFEKEIFREFSQPNYKVAIFDSRGKPVIWPFAREEVKNYDPGQKKYKSDGVRYTVKRIALDNSSLQLLFFAKYDNFNTYRIITIMFLLFALYFCIYQFMVELWQAKSAKSYFENIDFNILNNLKEGIVIANRFNRIIFANKGAFDLFPEKRIVLKETNLKEILGHLNRGNKRFTLKKSDKSLEIIRSPIFKSGKMLGSMVVVSENTEEEKSYVLIFSKLIEFLDHGVMFVGQDNEVNAVNMMAKYYLGNVEPGPDIVNVHAKLASAIDKLSGPGSVERITLGENLWAELIAVYHEKGTYAGTLVLLKSNGEYE